ncbi:glutamate racemase [Lactiplantibacillus mudanjiangensis]|uniref:Glutamate racemase n=1 Tax=Lactiplantibacillus mudanjiangensis TaxID=1296538 RepID=A0A660E175_9LACO|nr:glutamate racemase [Lactiplantibacillus mudanjiangensis]VDG24429.1 glutamate racemase [Lactobacillus paracollinoides] [Lactiplantibacillus mudanjiangensis]VDG27763.1 glutamate racemase [Lactobacillus paracollinoides] [Lactiplantibacillus mudanjiangensis]
MADKRAPIGVFDSGVGGISTLQTLAKVLPNEDFIFYGDSANAPYGEKDATTVCQLATDVIDELATQDVKAVVIACNTATSAAKPQLTAAYPDMPILGIEPALKEAVDAGKQHILVMGTPLTLSLPKYRAQLAKFGPKTNIYSLPCPGLADRIELGSAGLPKIKALLADLMAPMLEHPIDAVVLGCTHYPFIQDLITAKFEQPVTVYTGYEGIARNLTAQLQEQDLLRSVNNDRQIQFMSSRNTATELALYRDLFEHGIQA